MDEQMERGPVVLQPEERRSVAEALRIPTSAANRNRNGARAVMVQGGRALVTDSYVAVLIPALGGLPDGAWDADALLAAVKGAGSDWVAVGEVTGTVLEVVRFAPHRAMAESAVRREVVGGLPDAWRIGTFGVPPVDGAPMSIHGIWADALAAVEADDYAPEDASWNPDLLTAVFRARPGAFRKGQPAPVRIMPRGLRAGVVTEGGAPFAVVMPMRD